MPTNRQWQDKADAGYKETPMQSTNNEQGLEAPEPWRSWMREGERLKRDVFLLSRTISTDNDGSWWGDVEDDHLGNVAGYIGMLESRIDKGRKAQEILKFIAENFVTGDEATEMARTFQVYTKLESPK